MTDAKLLPNYTKFLFASLAGVGATLVCYPLDFVKTRMQIHGAGGKAEYISSFQFTKNLIAKEGYVAVYTGISASVLRQVTYTGVRMGVFQTLVDYFTENGKPPNILIKCACGVAAGVVGGIVGLPPDVVLTRMAADGSLTLEKRRNYKHVFDAFSRVYHEEGLPVLFRGFNAVVVRAVIVNISQLVSYAQAKEILLNYGIMKDNTLCHITCSIFSALTATTCVLPPDMAKTRMQNMSIINGKPEYSGMTDVWLKIVTKEGFFSLWKGFTPLFIRNGPQFIIVFVIYENLTYMYKKLVLKSTNTKV